MAVFDFEQDLINEWSQLKDRNVRMIGGTRLWIRAYLEYAGLDYQYNVWRQYQRFAKAARSAGVRGLRYLGGYREFTILWYRLHHAGLVVLIRRESPGTWSRAFYGLNPDASDEQWRRSP